MYIKNILFVLLVILGTFDIWSVKCSRHRSTTPALTERSPAEDLVQENHENEEDSRYNHGPYRPPKNPPTQNPWLYPPTSTQGPPVYTSHHPVHYPSQNPWLYPQTSTQAPAVYPPHYTTWPNSPQTTQAPPLYPPQTPPPRPPTYAPPRPTYAPPIYPRPPTYAPQQPSNPNILDQYDRRYPDGSYEFRYELPNETARYERGFFIHYQHKNILVVKGYYSYKLPDRRYLTVFYLADQYGYNVISSTYSLQRPLLPRSSNEDAHYWDGDFRSSGTENTTAITENNLLLE